MRYESDFRGVLTKAIKSTRNIAQPIETGSTGLGVPDMFIRTQKTSAWMELKNFKYPVHFPVDIPFRPGQAAWLERHYGLGGISILGVSTLEGCYFFVNENIRRTYMSFTAYADYFTPHIIGRELVRWLDNL